MTTTYFDDYFFTSDLTKHVCPGFGEFKCSPPNSCASDPNTGNIYCCDAGDICWGLTTPCATNGDTRKCGDGNDVWCCMQKTEICKGAIQDQVNICWSSGDNILRNISASVLNETYSSLSSAAPSASSFIFDPVALMKATATPSLISTSSTSTSISTNLVAKSTTPPSVSSLLPGGTIAAVILGALVLIALLAAVILLFLRRIKNKRKNAPYPEGRYEADTRQPANLYREPQELSSESRISELPSKLHRSELQGSYAQIPMTDTQERS